MQTRHPRSQWGFLLSQEQALEQWIRLLDNTPDQEYRHVGDPYLATVAYSREMRDVGHNYTGMVDTVNLRLDPLGAAVQAFMESESAKHRMRWQILDELDEQHVWQKRVYCMYPATPGSRLRVAEDVLLPGIVADWLGLESISPAFVEPVLLRIDPNCNALVSKTIEQMYRHGFKNKTIAYALRNHPLELLLPEEEKNLVQVQAGQYKLV